MKVAKWGNSLAVRLPAPVVAALELKEGDEIDLHVEGNGALGVARKPSLEELAARVRKMRGLRPQDFKFDREEANAR
ncbi:MAG: AbrB/MazE/SpoVT family DNA-binding domain-containing protein [Acidovorax sp.]|uniref:AbrB/MazE/SpoVT family DNA-binding domain-containing protein n=1 Tax=Acidovorax sp. TaxID=1872122 RepID=UPI0039E56841